MALQVWLPLMGDIHNQGLYPLEFNNTNAQVSASGCLGPCYSFTATTGTGINAAIASNDFLTRFIDSHSFSFCCWFKTTANASTPIAHITYGLRFFVGTSTSFSMYNSTRTVSVNANTATNDGKWHHYAATYDLSANKLAIYIDGVLKNTTLYTAGATYIHSWTNNFYIGRDPNNSVANAGYFFQGNIQDVRFYDHSLSAKEVKEISKGLAMHYKLDDMYSIPTSNLIQDYDTSFESYNNGAVTMFNNQMNGGTIEVVSNIYGHSKCLHIKSNGGNNRCYKYYSVTAGTYTISLDYYATVEGKQPFRLELNGGGYSWNGFNTYSILSDDGKWKRVYITFSPTATTNVYIFFQCETTYDAYFDNVQMEAGSYPTAYVKTSRSGIIPDCSGYVNDGVIAGTLTPENGSPRYESCIKFGGHNCYFLVKNPFYNNVQPITISFWFKPNASNDSYNTIVSNTSPHGGFWISVNTENSGCWSYNSGLYVHGSTGLLTNGTWYHLVWQYKGNNQYQWYCNGRAVTTTTSGTLKAPVFTDYFNIGGCQCADNSTSAGRYDQYGSISDLRIYGSVLSADDVAELYHTAASVDNKGNVHCYELKEV